MILNNVGALRQVSSLGERAVGRIRFELLNEELLCYRLSLWRSWVLTDET